MKNIILTLLTLCVFENLHSQISTCEVTDKFKVPENISNVQVLSDPNLFLAPNNLSNLNEDDIILNDDYIEKRKGETYYWRSEFIRKATKQDLKKYKDFINVIGYLSASDTIYNYAGNIYKLYKEKTYYPNWFAVNVSDFEELKYELYDRIGTNTFQLHNRTLPSKVRAIDLTKFRNLRLKIIDANSPAGVSFKVGDSLIIGTSYITGTSGMVERSNLPKMLKNLTAEKIQSEFRLANDAMSLRLLPGDFDIQSYDLNELPYFRVSSLNFKDDEPFLNLEYFDINDKIDRSKNLEKNLNTSIKFYNYDCVVRTLDKITKQRQKQSADYDTYLKKNYNAKEVEHIKTNAVFVGMSEKAMYESVGRPLRTNTTVVQNLTNKQCIYGEGVFIYVENGKIVGWQNIESLKWNDIR